MPKIQPHALAARALLAAVGLSVLAPSMASLVAGGMAQAQAVPSAAPSMAAAPPRPPSDSLMVVLLGTGVGPVVNLQQYGASILVEAGGQRFLFDCGRGATLRLAQAGVPVGSITRVFLTHLHSDHVLQLPDLLLTGWAAGRRAVPLTVWGPAGTRAMMDHLLQAFVFDIHTRRDLDERFPAAGITVVSHDVLGDSVVFAEGGVTVTAFLVDHGTVRPAFGYRVDYRGRAVVLSGDTRVSENLIRHASGGVDVLIHEAIDPETLRARPDRPSEAVVDAIVAHHTTPAQAGEVFRRVAPRLAVYSHAPNSARVLAQTRTTYAGPLEGAEDLLTIHIGADIQVEHHTPPPPPPRPPLPAPAAGAAAAPPECNESSEERRDVSQHQDARQLRAAGDRGRSSGVGAPVRTQAERNDTALARERGGVRTRRERGRGRRAAAPSRARELGAAAGS